MSWMLIAGPALAGGQGSSGAWPELDQAPPVGGGEADTATIVAIDDYFAVPDVPGAEANGADWYDWFVEAYGVPAERVRWLRGPEATAEAIRAAATDLGRRTAPEGRAWLVFVGHGASAPDGDPLLLGVDVQATGDSLQARGVRRSELSALLGAGGGHQVMVLDSCFSGLTADGDPLVAGLQPVVPTWAHPTPGATILAAGSGHQVAGPLPTGRRPAFSYLALGALQGWGDDDGDDVVTAREAVEWSRAALDTTLTGRSQTPALLGADAPLARSGGRTAVDLTAVVRARRPVGGSGAPTQLPPLPSPVDLSGVDDLRVQTVLARARAVERDERVPPYGRAEAWCDAARAIEETPWHAEAQAACDAWNAQGDALKSQRRAFFDAYRTLRDYLAVEGIAHQDKLAATQAFVEAFREGAPPQAWGESQGGDWYLRRAEAAQVKLERGRASRLPELRDGAEYETYLGRGWERAPSAWMITWNGSPALDYMVFPAWIGLAGETDGSLGVGAQVPLAFTIGPLDLALLSATAMADGGLASTGIQAGFQPFTHRPSRRHPGELRGSMINPIVGLGWRIGATTADAEGASWFEAYAANLMFVSDRVGLRVEGRLPAVRLGGSLPPPSWVVGPLINLEAL
jgi:hypothetical protein